MTNNGSQTQGLRGHRRPRQEFWANQTVPVREVREIIQSLDPVENDAEITHLSLEVIAPPMMAHAAYAAGTARGLTHPAEAHVGYRGGKGSQIVEPTNRDRDTLTFFGLFLREGHRSMYAQEIFDRVQQIHHDVRGVGHDLQIHVLGLLIVEADRWVRDFGVADFFSENERRARFSFWQGVGSGMGLHSPWASYEEVEPWVLEFEDQHFRPTREAKEFYRKQVEGFQVWFPGPTKIAAHHMLTAGLSPMTRQTVMARRALPGTKLLIGQALRAFNIASSHHKVNLSRTWVREFSRDGLEPDIHKMGYQHDYTRDTRYLKKGSPADGYRYTVADGIESLAPRNE